MILEGFMTCNGLLILPAKVPLPKSVTPTVLKFFNPPSQSSNVLLPPSPTGNKNHEHVKLTHKPLIQHNS